MYYFKNLTFDHEKQSNVNNFRSETCFLILFIIVSDGKLSLFKLDSKSDLSMIQTRFKHDTISIVKLEFFKENFVKSYMVSCVLTNFLTAISFVNFHSSNRIYLAGKCRALTNFLKQIILLGKLPWLRLDIFGDDNFFQCH